MARALQAEAVGGMPLAARIVRGMDRTLLTGAQILGVAAMVALFFFVMGGVALRYLSDQGAGWVNEVPYLLFPWLTACGFVIAALTGSHILAEALVGSLSEKVARPLIVLTHVAAAGLFVYLAWQGRTVISITMSERYPILGISTAWAYSALVSGCVVLALSEIGGAILAALTPGHPRNIRSDTHDREEAAP